MRICLVLVALLTACSTEQPVCEQAYARVAACLRDIDCAKVTDSRRCREVQQHYSGDYASWVRSVSAGRADWRCSGAWAEQYERIATCTLDPAALCTCK